MEMKEEVNVNPEAVKSETETKVVESSKVETQQVSEPQKVAEVKQVCEPKKVAEVKVESTTQQKVTSDPKPLIPPAIKCSNVTRKECALSMLGVAGWVLAAVIGYQLYQAMHISKMAQIMRVFGF